MNYKIIIISIFILLISNEADSQTKMHVVSKIINKSVKFNPGDKIKINAEAATIEFSNNTENLIQIKLQLISKNIDKRSAENDLEQLKYYYKAKNKIVFLSNNIILDEEEELQSILQAKYTIKLPKQCKVEIENSLGNISVKDISGEIDISLNYGNFVFNNIEGKLNANVNIGDITGKKANITAHIQAKNSVINLEEISGNFIIDNQYGQIYISPGNMFQNLKITSINTDVLLLKKSKLHNYSFKAFSGNISIADNFVFDKNYIIKDNRNSKSSNKEFLYKVPTINKSILISTKYGDIRIK